MPAAVDKIAGFVSAAPLSRSTLRRDVRGHVLKRAMRSFSRSIREWGYGLNPYEFRLKGRHPLQLLGSPDDPAPGNATLGSAIFGGDMLFEGESHALHEGFWKDIRTKATPSFFRYAHSFHWLQDLAQVGDQVKARDAAETMLGWWLDGGDTWSKRVWEAETLARRFINWGAHAPLILSSDDLVYRSKVLHSMARQLRHLSRCCDDVSEGLPQLYVATALTLGGLLLPGGTTWQTKGLKLLERSCKSFILPDGGPSSRNAADAIRSMQLLILVRNTFIDVNADLPPWIQVTLDRIAPFVRTVRHNDGSFAHIGGVSAEGGHGTDAILAASEAKGKAIENALHTGVQRLVAENTCLIVDAGTPPARALSSKASAATASFELSVGQERLVVNMGPASKRGPLPELADMSRTTAANSTLVVGDTNSSQIRDDRLIGAGVTETQTTRETLEHSQSLKVIHNGYERRFGVLHERTLELDNTGDRLKGKDRLSGKKMKKLAGQPITVRFHLHPGVEAFKAPDGRISLETKSGQTWIFDIEGAEAEVEDSLYLPQRDEPLGSKQIIVTTKSDGVSPTELVWSFSAISV